MMEFRNIECNKLFDDGMGCGEWGFLINVKIFMWFKVWVFFVSFGCGGSLFCFEYSVRLGFLFVGMYCMVMCG